MDSGLSPPAGSDVVDRIRARDEVAFTRAVAEHDTALLRLGFIIGGELETARDATQVAWQRLWERPPHLGDTTKLRSWLLTVVANEVRRIQRRSRRGKVLESLAPPTATRSDDETDELIDLRLALARLSGDDREVRALRFVVGLTSSEIAAHLRLTPEGARSRVHRAVERLRKELSDA